MNCFYISLTILYSLVIIVSPFIDAIVFGTFTYWSLVLQWMYYTGELLDMKESTRTILLNLATAPSLSVLSYWAIINVFDWPFLVPWYVDIFIHLFNIILLLGIVLVQYPYIKIIYIWIPMLFGFWYLIGTFAYTSSEGKLIYPTNVFSFDSIENKKPYGWVSFLFYGITTGIHILMSIVCKEIERRREFQKLPK